MAYSECIKNFEKVRAYMRDFYVYGFKSRTQYDKKSARSYDDERRRMESWLGDHMRFVQTADGKRIFLSIDSRVTQKNPLYKAWKAKSFTDGDITLHFVIFDILSSPEIEKTLAELVEEADRRLSSRMTFDESTLRKKLKEYTEQGIIQMHKVGRRVLYNRSPDTDLSALCDEIDFASEVAPCGVIGSFLQDRQPAQPALFSFKHHYITQAIDSDVMAVLFDAMHKRCYIRVENHGKYMDKVQKLRLVPLKIYISVQNGRQNLIAFNEAANRLNSYRLDYLTNIMLLEPCEKFDALRSMLCRAEPHMWGVNCGQNIKKTEHVEFVIQVRADEGYIVQRLEREKRCGRVEKIDAAHYRYCADVYDAAEMIPWIRTFLSRITRLNFSNRTLENQFKADLREMYRMYDIDSGDEHDIQ